MIERMVERGSGVRERASRSAFEEMIFAALGQRDWKAGFGEGECCLHVGSTPEARGAGPAPSL